MAGYPSVKLLQCYLLVHLPNSYFLIEDLAWFHLYCQRFPVWLTKCLSATSSAFIILDCSFFCKLVLILKVFNSKLCTSSSFWVSLMDVLLSPAHPFEKTYPWKIATRLPVCFVHADGLRMSPANLHDCATNQFHFSPPPLDVISTVVTQFLSPSIGNDSNWALCWQASTHGWAGTTFHSRCDGKSHTITVIRKDPYVFGGYTDIPWRK